VPTSVADILLETDRLTLALDAFIADPLDDGVRTDLIDLVDEVLEPILVTSPGAGSSAGERTRSRPRGKPAAGGAGEPDASFAALVEPATSDETPHPRRESAPADSPLGRVPDPPSQLALEPTTELDLPAGGAPSERSLPSPRMDAMDVPQTHPSVGGLEERLTQQQAAFQDRFDRLSRRMNAGFFLIGVVGLGLLALNLQEIFRRPQATADALIQVAPVDPPLPPPADDALVAPPPPPPPPPPTPSIDLAQIEALALQIQSSSAEIASSLATWGEGPGQVIADLSDRMASVEDEIANLKTGMDELSAELQSQSREPMLADADAGAQSPLLADGQPMEGGPDVSPAPPSDLTAMRWPDAEEDIGSEFDADRIAAAGTAPESSQADLDAPLMDVTETTDDALTVGTPTDQDSGSFTAAIPAEEMILTVSAYGVQLGAMRRESGARALADMTGLDPKTLFMQASGSWQFVILGWFAERDEARAAMDALPGTVRQLRPLIRFVEAGSRVKPVDGPVIR
jgi:hypothetical protein